MKTREMQKMIQAAAKESGIIISNYSRIEILEAYSRLGNPHTMEHSFVFLYGPKKYRQIANVTGPFSAVCRHETFVID